MRLPSHYAERSEKPHLQAGDRADEQGSEVLSKFNIKYGRFYEVRNRYNLDSVHAWGTTCFRKEDVEEAIAKYKEEQGQAQAEAYYTCFDLMQLYGLGKTQVRRFAETHGVRIKKAKGGRANLYLKADWEAARKKAETEVSETIMSEDEPSDAVYQLVYSNTKHHKQNKPE